MPAIMLNDQVAKVLGPVLVVLFCLLALPVTLILVVLVLIGFFHGVESALSLQIVNLFHSFHGKPESIAGGFMQFFAALVAALSFKSEKSNLTNVGYIIFIIALWMALLSFFLLWFLDPNSAEQIENIARGKDTLDRFVAVANYSMNTALIYLGLLTGLKGVGTTAGSAR